VGSFLIGREAPLAWEKKKSAKKKPLGKKGKGTVDCWKNDFVWEIEQARWRGRQRAPELTQV